MLNAVVRAVFVVAAAVKGAAFQASPDRIPGRGPCSFVSGSPASTVGEEGLLDRVGGDRIDVAGLAEPALALGRLLGEDMAKVHLLVLDLAGGRQRETLGGGPRSPS